ncbi:MAG: hypothetical protein A2X13_13585 [Bacteroidetes bacterium GWC2_33_15]|nr:MAG: hypothetical protein A2X10_08800 [Bacteroidetes bacterium GWA2_33_15]OFX50380.1 MAG: hypothetical protein A2X13_13585 [Bacteroidetes bacterium GWC2_33_15]OFX66702.1 MAG: hypothetical protein A2X15_08290 [Bacteroidetes bacterium GWB2_32_14]OFX69320.1 MAG: hypothetical protein A2X14_09220 [Bacteroidetes bacterium GWD2_33_33]HAN18637.1 histidinol-phosphatase [Bacteroidales bacterium]
MTDYHIHTILSDGIDTHEACLRMASEYNVSEIGFSDHICLNYPEWAVREEDLTYMKEKVTKIKNTTDLPFKVKFGAEIDYLSDKKDEIQTIIQKLKLDYVIGSVHFINGWNFDTEPFNYETKNIDHLYNEYFRLIQEAAISGLFDIIGHADVIKKFNYKPSFKLDKLYKQTAKIFSKADIAIELNTSGLFKPCNEYYPSTEFLKMCFKEKVPVTLGSDAHQAVDIARNFKKAINLLKVTGYKQIAVFEKRKRTLIPI